MLLKDYFNVYRHKHDDNHIVERTSLPDKLVKKVEGQTAFEETYPRVTFYYCSKRNMLIIILPIVI